MANPKDKDIARAQKEHDALQEKLDPGEDGLDLAGGELVGEPVGLLAGGVGDGGGVSGGEGFGQVAAVEDVAGADAVVVVGVAELEGDDAEVGEVLPVDAGERLGDDDAQSEVARGDGGVFAGGALPVVVAADDDVAAGVALVAGALRVGVVDAGEGEVGEGGDVGAQR